MAPAPDILAALEEAIRTHPVAAADALASIQSGAIGRRIDFDGLLTAARLVGRDDFEEFAVEQIAARRLIRTFSLALAARQVPLAQDWEKGLANEEAPLPESFGDAAPVAMAQAADEESGFDEAEPESDAALTRSNLKDIGKFEERALGFRCRVLVDYAVKGSGFLVGPSTVMTAWHVIAAAELGPKSRIEVLLADGQRIPAFVPVDPVSKCSAGELESQLPKSDDEVTDLHDVAVLTLKRPVGAALGVARLAENPRLGRHDAAIVAHFPDTKDLGLGFGAFRKLRGLSSRWGHTVKTRPGSSGAGCFDATYRVVGIHQGSVGATERGRLVPVNRFPPAILDRIASDEAPPSIWSLDGTIEGPLVVGRQAFFHGFAAASRAATRVRGIRIKRVDAAADPGGIPFSFRMLEQMVARTIETDVLRISFETIVPDLADEVIWRARVAGFEVDDIVPAGGVSAGQSSPAAVANDRGRRAATALDTFAGTRGRRLWVFLEHPSTVFSEELRISFEGFVDQALKSPHLRLVVAGYEAVSLPGQEFTAATGLGDEGLPGLLVEYIEGFTRADVKVLLRQAAASFDYEPTDAVVDDRAQEALKGLRPKNDIYDAWRAADAAEKLRPVLREWASRAKEATDG